MKFLQIVQSSGESEYQIREILPFFCEKTISAIERRARIEAAPPVMDVLTAWLVDSLEENKKSTDHIINKIVAFYDNEVAKEVVALAVHVGKELEEFCRDKDAINIYVPLVGISTTAVFDYFLHVNDTHGIYNAEDFVKYVERGLKEG